MSWCHSTASSTASWSESAPDGGRSRRVILDNALPLILIEGVLVFGGVLAFAWWQFRDLRREREKAARMAAAPPPPSAGQGGAGDGGLS